MSGAGRGARHCLAVVARRAQLQAGAWPRSVASARTPAPIGAATKVPWLARTRLVATSSRVAKLTGPCSSPYMLAKRGMTNSSRKSAITLPSPRPLQGRSPRS